MENTNNPKKKHFFPDYPGFPLSDEKMDFRIGIFTQKKLTNVTSIRKITANSKIHSIGNPEYHQLYFMHISPGYVRFGQVKFG